MEIEPKCIYQLQEIKKFLFIKHTDSESKPKVIGTWTRTGTESELVVIDSNGKAHELIETFIYGKLKEPWHRFLTELSDATGLPIEEKETKE
jgi:hypothetical protein